MTEQATVAAAWTPPDLKAPLEIDPAWDIEAAIALFLSFEVPNGETVPHEVIGHLLGMPYDKSMPDLKATEATEHAFERMGRLKLLRHRLLVEHSLWIKNDRGSGYHVVAPQDQATKANRDLMVAIQKEIRLAALVIKHTRTEELSNHERRQHAEAELKQLGLAQMIKSTRRNFLRGLDEDDKE